MTWLSERAVEQRCREIQLDSGVQRGETHRFYFREGYPARSSARRR